MLLMPFRSLQGISIVLLLGFGLLLRAPGFFVSVAPVSVELPLGPLGLMVAVWVGTGDVADFGVVQWLVGSLALALIGFVASFTLQDYRLGSAGALPGLLTVGIGSAAVWWLGFSPLLIGTLFTALAAQRLFAGHRQQGASLPIYDAGLWVGAAWLVAPGYLYLGVWALLAIAQLRRFRFSDALGLVIGVLTLPLLAGVYTYMWGDYEWYMYHMTYQIIALPSISSFSESWWWVAVAALATGMAAGAYGLLTTRRPIQEQRASRMWYAMLGVGWLAILLTNSASPWGLAYVLYPLAVLLGLWLSELKRERADQVAAVLLALIAAGWVLRNYLGPV